jgi:hypothetical protein
VMRLIRCSMPRTVVRGTDISVAVVQDAGHHGVNE